MNEENIDDYKDVFCKIVEEIGGVEECIRIKKMVEEVASAQEVSNKNHTTR